MNRETKEIIKLDRISGNDIAVVVIPSVLATVALVAPDPTPTPFWMMTIFVGVLFSVSAFALFRQLRRASADLHLSEEGFFDPLFMQVPIDWRYVKTVRVVKSHKAILLAVDFDQAIEKIYGKSVKRLNRGGLLITSNGPVWWVNGTACACGPHALAERINGWRNGTRKVGDPIPAHRRPPSVSAAYEHL